MLGKLVEKKKMCLANQCLKFITRMENSGRYLNTAFSAKQSLEFVAKIHSELEIINNILSRCELTNSLNCIQLRVISHQNHRSIQYTRCNKWKWIRAVFVRLFTNRNPIDFQFVLLILPMHETATMSPSWMRVCSTHSQMHSFSVYN